MSALPTASGAAPVAETAAVRPFADLDRQAIGCIVSGVASGLRDVLPVPEREPLPSRFEPLIRRLTAGWPRRPRLPSRRKAA
ncbi:hypothetical protein [Methylobacterium oxalidis]|uniref:hypothetical protein n=1 Tax=Methylobacterium oxalidis TaxID=944322 RepID=UPI003314654C